ncbi:hypothetical protein [Thermostichus vulcanus]|uniref:Uncharacterized protein n=1 Tax=Thermostichus vulcanus str. 'Rupite' TaxID=2813851 RepID=A0ABT0CAZ8_THEVL|nr:hypothetical protein [Thermostichus vulcanus]MCJ2542945.1 hypothetical protein [Thermostichus vulcanus str. 'Rupite']
MSKSKPVQPRQVVGVGTVGGIPGQATYTLYDPSSSRVQFRWVDYPKGGVHTGQGFASSS